MNSTKAKNATKLAPIFNTTMIAIEAPCAAASRILAASIFSILRVPILVLI